MTSALVGLLFLVAGATHPGPAGLQLFPLRGVFYPPADGAATLIDPDFRAAIGDPEKAWFERSFRSSFPDSVATLTDANKRRTFVVSIQVARASRYSVPKPDGTADLYLPVTASLYFTSVMTGEVLYAATQTDLLMGKVASSDAVAGSPRVRELFAQNYRELVDRLIAEAHARFQPRTYQAAVRGTWNGLAVLDRGREQGIERDDTLTDENGDELRIISAGSSYALGRLELGKLEDGSVFSKISNKTLAEIKKPRVLLLVESSPPGFPEDALIQLFSDALGESAPISLVPVNRTYADVLKAVASQSELSQEKLRQRDVPHLFIRLHAPDPVSFETATNLRQKRIRITDALVFAEVVDRTGRVLYAAQGRDHIRDEITGGMVIDEAARKEVAIKNALLDLAKRFGREFRIAATVLPIVEAGETITIRDEHGVLTAGRTLRAYHTIGNVGGIRDVRVPTWDLEVVATSAGEARVRPTLPVVAGAAHPASGDVVILDGTSAVTSTRKRFGPCGSVDKLGAVDVPEFGALAQNLFASSFPAPYYARGLGDRIAALVRSGAGFASEANFATQPVDYCVQPVHKIDLEPPSCDSDTCADVAQVKIAYRVRIVDDLGTQRSIRGKATRMTAATLSRSAPEDAKSAALHADLLDEVLKLAPACATALATEPF